MIRVMVIKEDEKGKAVFLYGGDSIQENLQDLLNFYKSPDEVKTLHCKNPTELLEKVGLI